MDPRPPASARYPLDASRIVNNLFIGSWPPSMVPVAAAGFKLAVFCARELPPPGRSPVATVHIPLLDDFDGPPLPPELLLAAKALARGVARAVQRNEMVLVTCAEGRNRSAFIAALALVALGWSPQTAVEVIRARRIPGLIARGATPAVLTNPEFLRVLGVK